MRGRIGACPRPSRPTRPPYSPLKLWRPRRFDGVALVVGSAAPDAAYPLRRHRVAAGDAHLPGLFWFCLPVTLLGAGLVRWAAPTVAPRTCPPTGPRWRCRDYGVLPGGCATRGR